MNLTQANRKANLAKWKKQSPAVIKSPLKAIHDEYPDLKDEAGKFIGLHPTYGRALYAANRGDGVTVKQIARSIA
jgi:hypothetical protein